MLKSSAVVFTRDLKDPLMSGEQISWAIRHFTGILAKHNLHVTETGAGEVAAAADIHVVLLNSSSPDATSTLAACDIRQQDGAEAFSILRESQADATIITLVANDVLGMVYAVLELADMAKYAADPVQELKKVPIRSEKPANAVRSITRLFTSEPEDKPWFYDTAFWDEYLTELVTQRFNRFTFSVGCGYDYLIDKVVLDTYFCFVYPFLLSVPGYDVKADGLPDAERDKNLEMIRYIGRQCKLRGLEFRLGLWNHAYDYGSGNTNKKYAIQGLNASNHAQYCRDALALLLQRCPDIQGLTFRVHFEGGVPEPTHMFWKAVMARIEEADNLIDIDFHSKGVTDELLEIMNKTGKKFNLSTKYWAEHMGPPYHQASIRNREFYGGKRMDSGSTGHHEQGVNGMETTARRSFTRYGYADFLKDDRTYDIVHRVWPGTQRILTWGDPRMAAGLGRSAGFCGSLGIEWFEPLSFKGKKGSGVVGGRELYEREDLKLGLRDWTKYLYTYRLLGRLSYNPKADPASWRRFLSGTYGNAACAIEESMGLASRILPFILLVHTPSVANNVYWPEMYSNIPLVRGGDTLVNPYAKEGWSTNADFDMEKPYNFMNTSPLDPVLVYKVNEFANDILQGRRSGKLSPVEIADWLESTADQADQALGKAYSLVPDTDEPTFRRLATDIRIMAGTGLFFARKFRAALAFSLYEKTGGLLLLKEALALYQSARNAWMQVSDASKGIYKDDITFGHPPYTRGHWADRITDIERDIAAVAGLLDQHQPSEADVLTMTGLLSSFQQGLRPACLHDKPVDFVKGEPVEICLKLSSTQIDPKVMLHYRHIDQSALYETVEMTQHGDTFTTSIEASYTDSPYGLLYFFEVIASGGDAWMVPGYERDMANDPYYVLQAK